MMRRGENSEEREYKRGSRKVESKRKDLVPGAIAAPFADLNALKA